MVVENLRIKNNANFLFSVLSLSPNQMHGRLPLKRWLSLRRGMERGMEWGWNGGNRSGNRKVIQCIQEQSIAWQSTARDISFHQVAFDNSYTSVTNQKINFVFQTKSQFLVCRLRLHRHFSF